MAQFGWGFDLGLLYENSWLRILKSAEHRVIFASNAAACISYSASLLLRLERSPTGQNCRSICFTYCALTLHCSYLTLISSYHSQSLAVQVPQQMQVIFFPNTHSLHSRDMSPLGFGIFQRLITNSKKKKKKSTKTFAVMLIKMNLQINTVSCSGRLTVILRWLEPVHFLSLTPAPGHLQSCSSSGEHWGSGLLKSQGFVSLHVHTETPINTLIKPP